MKKKVKRSKVAKRIKKAGKVGPKPNYGKINDLPPKEKAQIRATMASMMGKSQVAH